MCWNASVSINTYLFSLFASLFAYFNNVIDIYFFLFYHSFVSMQLTEYFIWSKTLSNELASKISFLLIFLQPIFAILAAFTSAKNYDLRNKYLIIYLCYLVILYIIFPTSNKNFTSSVSKNGHLIWNWVTSDIFLLCIWLSFIVIPFFIVKNYFLFFFISISFIITYVLYAKQRTWGSLWCWMANILSFWLIGLVFYKNLCM